MLAKCAPTIAAVLLASPRILSVGVAPSSVAQPDPLTNLMKQEERAIEASQRAMEKSRRASSYLKNLLEKQAMMEEARNDAAGTMEGALSTLGDAMARRVDASNSMKRSSRVNQQFRFQNANRTQSLDQGVLASLDENVAGAELGVQAARRITSVAQRKLESVTNQVDRMMATQTENMDKAKDARYQADQLSASIEQRQQAEAMAQQKHFENLAPLAAYWGTAAAEETIPELAGLGAIPDPPPPVPLPPAMRKEVEAEMSEKRQRRKTMTEEDADYARAADVLHKAAIMR